MKRTARRDAGVSRG
uniref:Uncharacterized protein n=1 Tax=Anguilla anguilla TaxID=7936 RepID=A0A0E9SCB5_ANGAN